MVCPYNEAQEANGHYCSDYAHVSKGFFFPGVIGYDVGDYSKSREDENVHFGVPEESE